MKRILFICLALSLAYSAFGQKYIKNRHTGRPDAVGEQYVSLEITSENLLAGDSILILAGETGVKTTPVRLSVRYLDGTTYTHTDTDTTFIYTYSDSLAVKVVGISDSFIEGTYDNNASISIDEQFGDAEAPYWIDLKNFNDGTGTLVIDFYYLKK